MFSYELTDEDYELPYNAPGSSGSYFELDDDFGKGYPSRRSDGVKLQTILGNSGDFDMERVGGPTGWGTETLDRGIKSFQKRNALEVDGWVRPGGPTITKMKEQYGGLLSDFEAPTPKQADTNLRLRDAGHTGFLKSKRQELLMPPIPGLPKPDDDILGANHSLVRTVRDSGMRDTPAYMAKSVRVGKQDGVVEARDFVNQLEQLIPGEGTKAIRGILHALAGTPQLQRAFFGGPVVDLAPIGVFEQGGQQRYEEAIKTRPWEDYENGRDPVAGTQIRDYRPERDGIPQIVTRPAPYVPEGTEMVRPRDAGAETPINDGLLDPTTWPEHLRAQQEVPAESTDDTIAGKATATDKEDENANAIQVAQAHGQQQPPRLPVRAEWQAPSRDFRTGIAIAEGGGQRESPWSARHPGSGAMGRYQLTHQALIDAGLKSNDTTNGWVPGNPLGIRSDDELRGNPQAQERAFDAVMRRNHVQLEQNGAYGTLNQRIEGIKAEFQVTQSGLLAAAHRQGADAVAKYMDRMRENGWNSNDAIKGLSEKEERIHRQIETRLRTFSNVR